MPEQKESRFGGRVILARLYWMFLGNMLWVFLLIFIFQKRAKFPSVYDAAFCVALASAIVVRYLDIRHLNGLTAEGEPATMVHWRRYAMLLAVIGIGAWVLIRAFIHWR